MSSRAAATILCLATLCVAQDAAAQGAAATSAGLSFLPRADVDLTWGSLITSDKRFDWLGQLGIDFDVTDYGAGRLRFQALVEGGLGRERRLYDLNHGNFAFDTSLSYRLTADIEAEAVIQHESRHVVDRENAPSISWNAAGVRLRYTSAARGLDGHAEVVFATQPAYVDYSWMTRASARYQRPLTRRLGVYAAGDGAVFGTDEALRYKNRVCGGRIEGGLRVRGEAATLEFFAGYERRIDAFPTDRFRVRWFTMGFRITSR